MKRSVIPLVLLVELVIGSIAGGGTFRNIVDSNGTFDGFTFTGIAFPSINNNQQLVFEGQTSSGVSGIFLADLSAPVVDLTVLVDTSGPYASFDSLMNTLTDSGLTAVHALRDDGEQEIFTVDTTSTVTPLVDTSGIFSSISGDTDLNDLGTIAFLGVLDTGGRGIYTSRGDTPMNVTTTISDTSGEFENYFIPFVNDGGDVVFLGSDSDAQVSKLVVDHPNGSETIIEEIPFGSSLLPYNLNNAGDVSYYRSAGTPPGIELFNAVDLSVDVIVDKDDGFLFFDPLPDMGLNNSGQVAFESVNRLVLADAAGFDVILEPGDALFGDTLSSMFYLKSLNDHGEISFLYLLSNGIVGIAVASTSALEADFDGDGDVDAEDLTDPLAGWEARFGSDLDGGDFLTWQRQFGSNVPLEADFDGDGDVDADDLTDPVNGWETRFGSDLNGGDFLTWQRQFGSNLSPLATSHAVPEPAALSVSFGTLAFLLAAWHRRRVHPKEKEMCVA